jgi:hypothetical protein
VPGVAPGPDQQVPGEVGRRVPDVRRVVRVIRAYRVARAPRRGTRPVPRGVLWCAVPGRVPGAGTCRAPGSPCAQVTAGPQARRGRAAQVRKSRAGVAAQARRRDPAPAHHAGPRKKGPPGRETFPAITHGGYPPPGGPSVEMVMVAEHVIGQPPFAVQRDNGVEPGAAGSPSSASGPLCGPRGPPGSRFRRMPVVPPGPLNTSWRMGQHRLRISG